MADANNTPFLANAAVRDRMHALVCDLAGVADVADGLAEILEEEADSASDGGSLKRRTLIRAAKALGEDLGKIHVGLDHLWLDTRPGGRSRRPESGAGNEEEAA